MLEAVRNWFELRATMKDARRLRAVKSSLDLIIVADRLKHIGEMLTVGQRAYAAAMMDEVIDRYPAELAELPDSVLFLLRLGRLDDAEAIALRGMQRNPDSRDYFRYYCDIADQRDDIAERLRRWRSFRRRYPAAGLGFRMEAQALLAAGEEAAAERLLAEGAAIVGDDIGLDIEFAQRAVARRDWPEAIGRWAVVRERYEHPMGVSGIATALIELGRYDEAEAELLAGRLRFPFEPQIVEDIAALAQLRGDLDTALEHWASLRADAPNLARAYTEPARLLRARGDNAAADAMITEGATRVRAPTDRGLHAEFAEMAERAGDWAEAGRRWQLAAELLRDDPFPCYASAGAWQRAGQPDAAEQVLTAALERFPTNVALHRQFAGLAEARGDLALAAERLRGAVAAEPESWELQSALARALERSGAVAEADAALAAAIALRPDDPALYVEHAAMATRAGRADLAAARLAAARERFGTQPGLARAEAGWLREQGRPAEAAAVLQEAVRDAPDNLDLLQDLGHLAVQQADWPTAEACWRGVLAQQPQLGWAHVQLADARRQQGRAAEADTALAAAREAMPQDFGIAAAWARLAAEARDWPQAQRRWAAVAAQFPAEGHPVWQQAVVLREAGQIAEAEALLRAGAARYPADPSFAHDLARLAESRRNWPEAERWWRVHVTLTPTMWWAHTALAQALAEQDRLADAEAALQAAEAALPGEPAILQERARLAERVWGAAERDPDVGGSAPAGDVQRPESDRRLDAAVAPPETADPPVRDLDRLIGPAGPPRPLPRSAAWTWYVNGWLRPWRLDRNHGTSFLTIACPDDFLAVRVGFANVLNTPWTVGRAIVCPSAAFGDHVNPVDATGAVRPDAAWRALTFAGGGRDRPDIVADPAAPTRIVVAGSDSLTDQPEGGEPVWTWTDWVPCRSLGPDPETGMRVVMLRAWVPGDETVTYPHGGLEDYRLDRAANRGFEYVFFGCSEDRVFRPTQTATDGWSVQDLLGRALVYGSMFHAVQFLTRHSVVQGMATGDSHHAGRFLRQAVTRLGAAQVGAVPFGYANAAVGGLPSDRFFPRLDALLPSVAPGYVVLPGWSFNDHPQPDPAPAATARRFLERLRERAARVSAGGAVAIWLTPIPRDAAAMTAEMVDAWHWLRDAILAQRAAGEIVVDAALLFGYSNGGRLTATFRPEYTADHVHPDAAGHDALGELIEAAMQRHLVIGPAAENPSSAALAAAAAAADDADTDPDAAPPPLAHPLDFHAACGWAREAAEARDWPEAHRRWALLRDSFPAEGHPLWQQAVALREGGDPLAARDLLLQGAAQYAADMSFPHDLARMAESQGDWPDAERWWRRFVALQPQLWWGHAGLANALREQGDTEAADAVLLAAHAAQPEDAAVLLEYARLAERRGDWAQAERRFAQFVDRFPVHWEGVLGQANALRGSGRLAEAEALLRQATARHPDVAVLQHDLARLSSQRQDWPQAEQDWRRYLAIDPHPWWAHSALAHVRLAQGDRTGAATILRAAYTGPGPFDPMGLADAIEFLGSILDPSLLPLIEQLDAQIAPLVEAAGAPQVGLAYANAARYLGRLDAFRTRVEALAARFPREPFVRIALHDARELAPREDDLRADTSNPAPPAAGGDAAAETFHDEDLLRFESLGGGGDRGGCEFGLLQRQVGEPLSLLRWASIEPEQLAEALERRFEGLGNPDTLSIESQHHFDWKAVETVYGIRMDHTHLDRQTVSREAAAQQVLTRLTFLSRKLINDLGEADKLFLYRFAGGIVPEPTLLRLSRAVAGYGAARLLVTCEGDALPSIIEYREVAPNLLLVVRPNTTATDGLELAPRLPAWRQICQQALRWRQGALQTPARLPYPDEAPPDAAAWMDGETRIPRNFHAACAWAQPAVEAKDWPEARRRWAKLRELFPAEGHPAWQEAVALREAGEPEAARVLLAAGAARFPRDSSFPHDLARLAEAAGDWPAAERWWRAFLVLHPDVGWAYSALVQALVRQDRVADAEAALLAAQDSLPDDPTPSLEHARLAEQRHDWPEAARRYHAIAARFPQRGEALWGLAALARAQGRPDEAEQRLREGAERFPAMTGFAHDLGRLAESRRDWPEAERMWRLFLAHDDRMWWAHTALGAVLHAQGRLADADAVWQAAEAAFPGEPVILAEQAQVATNHGDWELALQRWTRLSERFPDDPRGPAEAAFALCMLDRAAEAQVTLTAAAERFPREARIPHDLARLAESRQDWPAAERWWRRLAEIDPANWLARLGVAATACEQGDVARAMPILAALADEPGGDAMRLATVAAVAFANAPDLTAPWLLRLEQDIAALVQDAAAPPTAWLAYANLAKRQERFEECRDRLELAAARFPDDAAVRLALADAREVTPREADAAVPSPAPPDQAADVRLLRHFESLGGNLGGCEFGFHQRDLGLEPLSLLRWASIQPAQLCHLLEQRFAGLGSAETVSLREQGHNDWQAVELTYGIQMDHTHLDRRKVTLETATRLVCNMLKFLARKLADDLQLGEKVFVYRMLGATLAPELVARLERAVAAYGNGRLLLVAEGRPATLPIELQRLSPRCLLVLREELGMQATQPVRLASWQAVCRAAAEAFSLPE